MSVMLLLDGSFLADAQDFAIVASVGDTDFECTFRMPFAQIERLRGARKLTVGFEEQIQPLQLIGYERQGERALVHGVLTTRTGSQAAA